MNSRRLLVVTGAAGEIATAIRPFLAERFAAVRLVDVHPIVDHQTHEECIVGDLHDPVVIRSVLREADALIHLAGIKSDVLTHLAGIKSEAPWAELQLVNAELVDAICTGAEEQGVRRIALASSMHVMGLYRRAQRISPKMPARPDSAYATSKLTMESIGRWHALRTGARVCSVRIGAYRAEREYAEPCAWIGGEDLARLFEHVLYHPRGDVPVVHAVAPYRGDDCGQRRLYWQHGFAFLHKGGNRRRDFARMSMWYPNDLLAREYRGGEFASRTLRPPGV